MQVSLSPKHPEDPHDIHVVAPDAVRTAPADEELSKVLRVAARCLADQRSNTAPDVMAEMLAAPPVPPVDTTFRPTAVNDDVRLPGHRPSLGSRALRGFTALLLTAGICAAGIVWHSSGDAAKKLVAKWGTQLLLVSSSLTGSPAQPDAPVVQSDAENTTDPQPAAQAEAAAVAVPPAAPSAEQAQLMQSMRNDLASLGQEVEQLKANIEQLKAGQQQASRDAAKVSDRASDPNLRPKKLSVPPPPSVLPPPRSAAAPMRRPMPPYYPPSQAAVGPPALSPAPAPYPPPAAAPYVPQQIDPAPPATTQTLADPELSSVPRPPMPLSR
jgi:hypothetical protein